MGYLYRRVIFGKSATPWIWLVFAASVACAQPSATGAVPASPLIVLIGGFNSDPSPEQLAGSALRGRGNSGLYQLRGDLLSDQKYAAEYFNWNGTRAGQIYQQAAAPAPKVITQYIRQYREQRPECQVIVVGNSWGGHTAWEVCTQLAEQPKVPIELLVFLDPSSAGRSQAAMPVTLPDNVQQAVNYHTRNLFVWRNWLNENRITNIDLGDPAQGFMTPFRPYDATFNWQAHVAAEWDDRIHQDICRRIQQRLSLASTPD